MGRRLPPELSTGTSDHLRVKQEELPVEQLRARIDELDDQILTLLNQRAQLALGIAREKRRRGLAVSDPMRERRVVGRLHVQNHGPLPAESLERIYLAIMGEMRLLQEAQAA